MSSIAKKFTYPELRQAFLEYFHQHGHEIVASSSLVPANDPTLLFTNAGMVQFKDVFLGIDNRPYVRATSAQRCVRAGGKHNDLDNVGYTARHHTFFEMLGNFSFGDYFKREAIKFAWEFLTQVLQLPVERLWITVYEEDQEAADIWLTEIKADPQRFSRCGAKDNFWSMGETGPCGPCTEIFYDHGADVPGGPPGSPDADGDRYVEIWNLVFMQYDRNQAGELKPLPKPSVDTGCGLERLAAVMQGVRSNYETDLFVTLIQAAAKLAHSSDIMNSSLRVIADHIRSTSFLISDGVIPSNEGRGYVLRRIIRRAIRHGNKLGIKQPFFHKLVPALITQMGDVYPELVQQQAHISRILLQEEEQFAKTLEQGLKILEQDLTKLTSTVIPGATVFRLYDTFGFPLDLTADIARERGLEIDVAGFEQEMATQKRQSQDAGKFDSAYQGQVATQATTLFLGYQSISEPAVIVELFNDSQAVTELKLGETGIIVLNQSPFYAESGGQVGDQGLLQNNQFEFEVLDTKKAGKAFLHQGRVIKGSIKRDEKVSALVNIERRGATAGNHTATHLLHAALRKILGSHVLQKGSLVEPARLRFDFTHYEALIPQQLNLIEKLVNQQIRANLPLQTNIMSPDDALASGAIGLFGEKYGSAVRVLSIANFSLELCGGTHVTRTGDIGFFKIISETGIAAGIRRIEAVTGSYADEWIETLAIKMREAADLLKTNQEALVDKLKQMLERNRHLEKQLDQWQSKLASSVGNDLLNQAQVINGLKVLAAELPNADSKILRETVDQLKQKLGRAVVVLGSITAGRVNLVAGVTKDAIELVKAGDIINHVALQVGGKGGGRPDLAQAGGNNPEALTAALASCYTWVEALLNK